MKYRSRPIYIFYLVNRCVTLIHYIKCDLHPSNSLQDTRRNHWTMKYKSLTYKWAATWQNQQCGCAPSEDSDQPGHPPSLIRVFAVRMKRAWVLSYPLSAQRRLWSDWADGQADLSLRWAHTHFVGFVMSRLIYLWAQSLRQNDPYTKYGIHPSKSIQDIRQNHSTMKYRSLWSSPHDTKGWVIWMTDVWPNILRGKHKRKCSITPS